MTGLLLQSIVSFDLHPGHQPSQPWARRVASAFDTLQSDLGESLKADGSSTDASKYHSRPRVQHLGALAHVAPDTDPLASLRSEFEVEVAGHVCGSNYDLK